MLKNQDYYAQHCDYAYQNIALMQYSAILLTALLE